MIDYSQASIAKIALHRVGNRHLQEPNVISDHLLQTDMETEALLSLFFLKPFGKCTEVYRFSDFENNEVCTAASGIFDAPEDLLGRSVHMLMHLHAQSGHPHIKQGELFVARILGLLFEEEMVEAIGIFKAETRNPFFQFDADGNGLSLRCDEGVSAHKLDKGCLVLNTGRDEGYRVLMVDANNYDADYWKCNFLNLVHANDNHFQTRRHMEMVKEFAKEVLAPGSKTEQIGFVNETVAYLHDKGEWDNDDFGLTVLRNADLQNAFNDYRQQYSDKAGIPLEDSFDISVPELQNQKRRYRNQILLDNHIQIKLPFSPDGQQPHIERGYDEGRGMFFYKIYFLNELE